jgi:hypothetical protein
LVLLLAIAASACSSSGSSSGSAKPKSTPTSSKTGNGGVACGAIRSSTQELSRTAKSWHAGNATRNEVAAAARKLEHTVSTQAQAAGGAVGSALNTLGDAIQNVVDTMQQPGVTKQQIKNSIGKVGAAAAAVNVAC